MTVLTADQFGDAVMGDYWRRQAGYRSIQASAAPSLRSKALGHPEFEDLEVGGRKLASLAVAFIDLTDFTGRSFWDDEDAVVDLAHAVLSAFVEIVSGFGGFPLGLRGDGLFAGFGPGRPEADAVMALGACAHALNAVEQGLNPRLEAVGIRRVQARAGVDYGRLTFVRSGSQDHSEVNVIGFAANFAAKCEKQAKSWEVVVGEGVQRLLPDAQLIEHEKSPKRYQRDHLVRYYRFYDYRWRTTLPHIPGTVEQLDGHPSSRIAIQ
jgi:class 3 adenylate cyclase